MLGASGRLCMLSFARFEVVRHPPCQVRFWVVSGLSSVFRGRFGVFWGVFWGVLVVLGGMFWDVLGCFLCLFLCFGVF